MGRSDKKKVKSIRRQIEKAFARRRYPGDHNLVPGVGGQSADDEEEIMRDMAGKHWRDLSAEFLFLHRPALFFSHLRPFAFTCLLILLSQ